MVRGLYSKGKSLTEGVGSLVLFLGIGVSMMSLGFVEGAVFYSLRWSLKALGLLWNETLWT